MPAIPSDHLADKADPKELAKSKRFSECMAKNGFPPLEPDANGMIHEPTDTPKEQLTPEFDAAVAKCRHLYDDKANDQSGNG